MAQGQSDIGQTQTISTTSTKGIDPYKQDLVLEKGIFNNIFEKDIRRVFMYKKAERLAKALHLITPAFTGSPVLGDRLSLIGMTIVETAMLPTSESRLQLSRELLTLSSVLSIARTSGLLSGMNVDLIAREAHALLHEVTAYEEPRLALEDAPTLADLAKTLQKSELPEQTRVVSRPRPRSLPAAATVKDTQPVKDIYIQDRRDAILSVIKNKKKASIKDLSLVIRDVSEKTIQRELLSLISLGVVMREGERRWSTYSLV